VRVEYDRLGRNSRPLELRSQQHTVRWNYRVINSGGNDWIFNSSLNNNRKNRSPSPALTMVTTTTNDQLDVEMERQNRDTSLRHTTSHLHQPFNLDRPPLREVIMLSFLGQVQQNRRSRLFRNILWFQTPIYHALRDS